MNQARLFQEIIATYRHHEWQLREVLLSTETEAELGPRAKELFGDLTPRESAFDALWFARPSPGGREAWELRLAAEQPYALFEAFNAADLPEHREQVRQEMEARMAEAIGGVEEEDREAE